MQAINVDGAANTLGLAAELGIGRIVHTSSIAAYGDTGGTLADESARRRSPPRSFYELTKAEAHAIGARLQRSGAPLIMACPAQVIGPGDHSPFGYIVKLWARGLFPPLFWTPEGAFSFVHVDDVAEGIALSAERGRPGENYLLSAGLMRIRELMDLLATTPGGMRVRGYLPLGLASLVATLIAPALRLAGYPAFISREAIRAMDVHLAFKGEKAMRELSWRPRGVEQLWRETLAAERAALGKPAAP
jgi:nucleoside-diphosphate-sugar epimerase